MYANGDFDSIYRDYSQIVLAIVETLSISPLLSSLFPFNKFLYLPRHGYSTLISSSAMFIMMATFDFTFLLASQKKKSSSRQQPGILD